MPGLELPLVELPRTHPCHRCGQCCTYVAVQIDNPRSFENYENVFWYLTHRGVSVYIDWDGDWYIEFETVCEHLTEVRTCAIYERRPKMCSDFSFDECEVTTRESPWRYRFTRPDEFEAWHAEKRPESYRRYQKRRRRLLEKRAPKQPAATPA